MRQPLVAATAWVLLGVSPNILIEDARGTGLMAPPPVPLGPDAGIRFDCSGTVGQMAALRARVRAYLGQAGISRAWVIERSRPGQIVFTLNTPADDTATLDFVRRAGMDLRDDIVLLPSGAYGETRETSTVSVKEILLALLQHGRLTVFPCSVEALKEHVGVRRNVVAWAENLEWRWPDGGPAAWNRKYWHYGTPSPRYPLHEAVNDAFLHQTRYRIGCYTATKLAVLQGVLDYYRRVRPDAEALRRIEARLAADGEPLVGIEPAAMWYFEDDYSEADGAKPGKLVELQRGVAPDNFVPGDWLYLRNTDPRSHAETGYEGSNAIYLGRDRFDDYYNDNHHHYTFREKIDEVYQWRNDVFSRSRDAAKAKPLSESDLAALARTPQEGGLLEDYRAVIAFDAIAYEDEPAVAAVEFPLFAR